MPLALDPILLEVLACPDTHHAPLRVGTEADPDAEVLTCTECGRRFPVLDGIPVLLLDEAMQDGVDPGSTRPEGAGPDGAADGRQAQG